MPESKLLSRAFFASLLQPLSLVAIDYPLVSTRSITYDAELKKCVGVEVIKTLILTLPDVVWSGSMFNSWKFC